MDSRTLSAVFIASCLAMRTGLTIAIIMRTNPSSGLAWVFSGWNIYVAAVTTVITYGLAIVLLKGRSLWLTALIGGLVATIISLPAALSTIAGRNQMGYSLSLAFFEWFIVALAAHAVVSIADQRLRRRNAS